MSREQPHLQPGHSIGGMFQNVIKPGEPCPDAYGQFVGRHCFSGARIMNEQPPCFQVRQNLLKRDTQRAQYASSFAVAGSIAFPTPCCPNRCPTEPSHLYLAPISLILLVPGEGFEPPTFGLQNRCTASVLTRQDQWLGVFAVLLGLRANGLPEALIAPGKAASIRAAASSCILAVT
jgi:hypothetical protein